jgi:hypothetical protein
LKNILECCFGQISNLWTRSVSILVQRISHGTIVSDIIWLIFFQIFFSSFYILLDWRSDSPCLIFWLVEIWACYIHILRWSSLVLLFRCTRSNCSRVEVVRKLLWLIFIWLHFLNSMSSMIINFQIILWNDNTRSSLSIRNLSRLRYCLFSLNTKSWNIVILLPYYFLWI